MNSRKPVYATLFVGVVVILSLTFLPYSLFQRARQAVTGIFYESPEESVPAAEISALPAFDAAQWYVERGEDLDKHGVLIESLDGRRVYASHNADRLFNPASLLKLATSLAVLKKFGPDHRFETRVYVAGETDPSGALNGKVYLASDNPVFGDGYANIVAQELRARGVKRLNGELVVSQSFSFNFSESASDSAKHAAKVMQLKEKGTDVGEPPSGDPLFVVKSQTLREIILYMNAHSNNFVAERLGAHVGGSYGLERFLVEELKLPAEEVVVKRASGREQNRMTARGVVVVVRALKAEAERHGLRLEDLMPVASDDSGTLRRRLRDTPLQGAALGKTGTLTAEVDGGMATLAGVVYTEREGGIVFAFLDQGNRIAENRDLEDMLLNEVIASNDTPIPFSTPETPRRLLSPASLVIEPVSLAETLKEDERVVAPAPSREKDRRRAASEPRKVRQSAKGGETERKRGERAKGRRKR